MVQEKEEAMLKRRVLYIGSSVPLETSDGLDAIQQPLRERYPANDDSNLEGIMSFLTILPSGLQLQYENEPGTIIWFPITSLTLCAAVRCITTINTATAERVAKFVSLSSPAAGGSNAKRPAIFTAITRRTTGKRVLECHGFVCGAAKDALDLVRATSMADRLSKGKLNGSVLQHQVPVTQTRSMGLESAPHSENTTPRSTPSHEYSVRLVQGEYHNGAAPEFFGNPPQHGYFYSTKPQQVKKYNVEKLSDPEPERLQAASSTPVTHPMFRAATLGPRLSTQSRAPTVASVPMSATMTLPPPPPRPVTIPVRVVTPPMQHAPPPPVAAVRPRFFSPPPPMMRPRMVPRPQDPFVFMPPPPVYVDQPYVVRRSHRRRGSASSGSHSSRSFSPPRNGHDETFAKRTMNGDADASSEVSSRPRTPPTDYEGKTGFPRTRISRREQFELRQRPMPPGPFYPHPMHPYDYYVYPPNRYSYMPFYATRPRSMPPPTDRGKKPDKKKGRKNKKDKKSKRRVYGAPSDISTDSIGYQSEIPANMMDKTSHRIPRDFRRFENQHKNERAFSSSLAKEGRYGTVDESHSAYSLNEHMASRGRDGEGEFNLY
ncbi:serine/arginine repetitive matrix protein 1-like [Gigantopelta aegis]|uniref:serine/arginine repetitive matrix protein 1-like n=1 Tax=Gigantopelta aegis TaxID=1735272 RepID=UPI001B88C086|nr:serine/arginine repetitive matrix protein 1-like [Gigantopelta aegis]